MTRRRTPLWDEINPYTYCLTHRASGKRYYGVRTKPKAPPERDLWNVYFSSSPEVRKLIIRDGIGSFDAEVRKVFITIGEAMDWEGIVLRRLKVKTNDRWLNSSGQRLPLFIPTRRDVWVKSNTGTWSISLGRRGKRVRVFGRPHRSFYSAVWVNGKKIVKSLWTMDKDVAYRLGEEKLRNWESGLDPT